MAQSSHATDDVPEDAPIYQPQDAVSSALQSTLILGTAGLLMSAVQNTVYRQNIGPFGIISRFGGTTAMFATVGATYGFTSVASANLRESDDLWAQVHGGAAAGALFGLRNRSMASALGTALLFGGTFGAVAFTGGTIFGNRAGVPEMDGQEYKEMIRKRFRRPINEVVNEIGEGRGIYPPGYDERRNARVKAAYGIDPAEQPYYKGVSASNHV